MSAWWKVDLTLGTYSWSIEETDDPDLVNFGPLSGMSFGWNMPVQDVAPVQPDPMFATFAILVPDVDQLEDVDIDTRVSIEVYVDPVGTTPVFSFYGRVTDETAEPHDRGMLHGFTALDDLVDNLDPIGDLEDWPIENIADRVTRIFAGTGITPPAMSGVGAVDMAERGAAAISVTEAAIICSNSVVNEDQARYILAPVISGGDLASPGAYTYDELVKDHTLPVFLIGEFGPTDDGYGPDVPIDPSVLAIDACYILRSARWVRRKFGRINTLVIQTGSETRVYSLQEKPVINGTVVTDEVYQLGNDHWRNSARLLQYYLPDRGAVARWSVESLTYNLSRNIEDDPDLATSLEAGDWMPHTAHSAPHLSRVFCYGRVAAVIGIPANQNPGASQVYAGQLQSVTLNITGGELLIDFTIRRRLPKTISGTLTPGGLAASAFAAVRVDELDPDFTVYDYRLAKEA